MVGSPDGPVGLLLGPAGTNQPAARLQRLEAGQWTDLSLPPGFFPRLRAWMAAPPETGTGLSIGYAGTSAGRPGALSPGRFGDLVARVAGPLGRKD